MMDLRQYWGFVRGKADELSRTSANGVVYITSLEDTLRGLVGGRVCEASPQIAARCLIDRTHRQATAEEIETCLAERAKREEDCATAGCVRSQGATLGRPAGGRTVFRTGDRRRELAQHRRLFDLSTSLVPHVQPQPEPARTGRK